MPTMKETRESRDALGQEMADDAKIWRTYAAESSRFDDAVVAEWNRTTDIILLFAALFSAVVTAFCIESYKLLGPNPQDITNALLSDISRSLDSQSNEISSPPTSSLPTQDFSPSTSAIWINALWFSALACSLGVGSLGMLVKQWLSAYLTGLPVAPRLRAHVRQYRYDTLRAWRTHDIINFMPLALSACLIIFLAGLSILLFESNRTIGILFAILVSFTVLIHTASVILPAISNCPWRTAISPVAFAFVQSMGKGLRAIAVGMYSQTQLAFAATRLSMLLSRYHAVAVQISVYLRLPVLFLTSRRYIPSRVPWPNPPSELHSELDAVQEKCGVLEGRALLWLIRSSSNKILVDSTIQSLAGLPVDLHTADLVKRAGVIDMIRHRLAQCSKARAASSTRELYIRALLRMRLVSRYLDSHHQADLSTQAALSGIHVSPYDIAYVTYICARGALTEIVDTLEEQRDGVAPLARFQIFMLAHTLGQDAAWHKAPKVDHWTMDQNGQMAGRAVPLLVDLLRVDLDDGSDTEPDLADAAIAFAIAIFTQGSGAVDPQVYLDGNKCREDFYYLVVTGLSVILRFPASYGCANASLEVARQKYSAASRKYVTSPSLPRVADRSALMSTLRSSLKMVAKANDSPESLLLLLSQMGDKVLAGLDCALLIHALDAADPSPMFNFQLLVLLERLVWDCKRSHQIASTGLTAGLQNIIHGLDSPVRSQAIKLLGRTAHMVTGYRSPMQHMITEGFYDLVQDLFARPGSINQDDCDLWLATLTIWGEKYGHATWMRRSGAGDALLKWAAENWRGRELTAPHEDALKRLARVSGITLDLKPSAEWFRQLVASPKDKQMKPRIQN
ncbi:hypothetical protein HGRIS_013545 [Hohenbuehelia grisea]|uniref:DUF6535 domain-containing protein n=1 Tax=Hohenbuehelia grisea TaxID=104357 RepID=A0ABR3IVU9_9AGAR